MKATIIILRPDDHPRGPNHAEEIFVVVLKLHKIIDYKMIRLDEPAGLLIHPPLWEA